MHYNKNHEENRYTRAPLTAEERRDPHVPRFGNSTL